MRTLAPQDSESIVLTGTLGQSSRPRAEVVALLKAYPVVRFIHVQLVREAKAEH